MNKNWFYWLIIPLLFALYPLSRSNYLLFHTIVEVWAIVVASGIFLVAWNTKNLMDESYLLFLGGGYLLVAVITFFHTITYYGMNIFPDMGPDPATQFWMLGRFLETFILVVMPFFMIYSLKRSLLTYTFLGMGLFTLSGVVSILLIPVFPTCFEEGVGLTPFKVYSEYGIVLILLLALFFIYRRSREEDWLFQGFSRAIIFTILAELSFTLYSDVYGFFNFLGHIFYLFSFYLIYQIIFTRGLQRPTTLLFHQLHEAEKNLRAINRCLLSFDQDNRGNIQRIVNAAGELFQGQGASFNEMKRDVFLVQAQWQISGPQSYPITDSICQRITEQDPAKPLYMDNLQYSPHQKSDPRLRENPYQAIFGCPVITTDRVLGTLIVFFEEEKGQLSPESFQTLSTLAQIISDEYMRLEINQSQKRSLKRARTLQASLFPTHLPSFTDLSVAASYWQAQEISGDYFNLHHHEQEIFFLMVDVTGHGLDAALITVFVSSFFRREMEKGPQSPEAFLIGLHHDFLQQRFPDDYSLEAFCGRLDVSSKTFQYAGAGSIRALKIGTEQEVLFLPKSTGSIINNYIQDPILGTGESHLDRGEALLIYTDGVDEPFLIEDRKGGQKRMEHFSKSFFGLLPFQDILDRIINDTLEEMGEHQLHDDMAIMGFIHCSREKKKTWRAPHHLKDIPPFIETIMEEISFLTLDPVPVQMALSEAVNNAREHGGENVTVSGSWTREELILRVTDDGPGYNWKKRLAERRRLLNMESSRGRGLEMIRLAAHRLALNRKGSTIAMSWSLKKNEKGKGSPTT